MRTIILAVERQPADCAVEFGGEFHGGQAATAIPGPHRIYANQEALALAQRAMANAEKLKGAARHAAVAAAALVLAEIHPTLRRWEEAIADFALAEEAAREGGDRQTPIVAIVGRAGALSALKRLEQAEQHAARAYEHLEEAARIFDRDVWNRWRYNIRLQAERASYWIGRGDLKQAAAHAAASPESAKTTLTCPPNSLTLPAGRRPCGPKTREPETGILTSPNPDKPEPNKCVAHASEYQHRECPELSAVSSQLSAPR